MDRLNRKKHEYLRRVRRSLVCPRRERARLLSTARRAVDAFLEENPEADENDWQYSLGTPEEFAFELVHQSAPEVSSHSLTHYLRFVKIISLILTIFLFCAGLIMLWYWKTAGYVVVTTHEYVVVEDLPDTLPPGQIKYYSDKKGGT